MTAACGGPAATQHAQAGFTLLEVLVALTVLGFLVAGLTGGVRFGLLAWDRQERAVEARAELDALDRLLRRLVERMDPGTSRAAAGAVGGPGAFRFNTEFGPAAGPLGGREAEAELLARDGRLLLRWRPLLHAERFGPPPAPVDTELLRGVAGLELSYFAPTGVEGGAGWRSRWAGRDLPALVRIRLRFAEGDPRRWPDIVAAPMRERFAR